MSPRNFCQKGRDYRQDILHSDSRLLAEILYTMLLFSVWESSFYSSHTYARLWLPEELGNQFLNFCASGFQPQKKHHLRDVFAYFIDREAFKFCICSLFVPKAYGSQLTYNSDLF